MNAKAKTAAGIYVRISRDRVSEVSTDVQERDARALCDARGWSVIEVYTDAGRSAFKRDTPRPAFDRLRADIEAGRVNVVVAYKLDRVARNVGDFADLDRFLQEHRADIVFSSQPIDTTGASGKLNRNILSAFAEFESELKSERIGGSMAHKAANGKPHPAGTRLFGYTPSRDAIDKDEAKEIRAAARRVLKGESLASIARDMNDRGITTTAGGAWRPSVLGRLLRNPFLAGLRVYKGETIVGEWPTILDAATHADLLVVLDSPERTTTSGGTTPRHLLSGIAYCGLCDARLASRPLNRDIDRYVCVEAERGGCGKISVNMEPADEAVKDYVLDYLERHADTIAEALGAVDVQALEREAGKLAKQQQELAEDWARGELSRAEWRAARDVLTGRSEDIARQLQRADRRLPPLPRQRSGLERLWTKATPAERRSLVRLVVDRVVVNAAKQRGRWDPKRVEVVELSP
jgi:DNA invertase Pin-like site-specific DNA recombinase